MGINQQAFLPVVIKIPVLVKMQAFNRNKHNLRTTNIDTKFYVL